MSPSKIKIDEAQYLSIEWNDGNLTSIKLANLRRDCPCAICKAEFDEFGENYIPIFSGDQIRIKSIKTVGNYAINIFWHDGHDTGIYDYDYLRKISNLKLSDC